MVASVGGSTDNRRVVAGVQTLDQLLPVAARRHSTRPALLPAEGRALSFGAVDRAANAVAAALLDLGVTNGDRIVVAMHKTPDAFVLIHGILRVGAVVVPLDPLTPTTSLAALTESTDAVAMVVDTPTLQRFDPSLVPSPALGLLTADAETPNTHPSTTSLRTVIDAAIDGSVTTERITVCVEPDDPAYVISTSGSTGVPKGMVHSHRSAMAYARLAVDTHGIGPTDRLSGLPPLHFDMSTLELYAAPLAGAAVMPVGTAELRFPATFTERAEQHRLTMWYAVPFQLRQISERGALDQRDLSSLRHIVYAGEAFPHPSLAELMTKLPHTRVSNAYGPAETNVVTVHELDGPPTEPVPIGIPWGEVQVRVVRPDATITDPDHLVDVPVGEQGELWFCTDTMMDGYLGRPDLTAERMVGSGDDRWYRTGDLAHLDDRGQLRLAGRIDHQVKVRGTRLELEAIEAILVGHPDILDAVVAPDRAVGPPEHLVAAVLPADPSAAPDLRALRRWAMTELPTVAVPASFTIRDSLPLTSSGKVDRQAVRAELSAATTPTGDHTTTKDKADR